jgi:Protein of unknown function (DUF4232)
MRAFLAVVSLLGVVGLAGCGGSSSTVASTTAPDTAPASSTSSTVTTVTSTVTTSSAASTTAAGTGTATSPQPPPPGSGVCVAAGLALSFLGGQGATGHGELGYALKNIGTTSCRTYGFPGVLFLDRSGTALPTNSTRTTQDFFGTVPARPLVIAPGASASFRLGVTHGISSTVGCTTAYGLQVIPPNDTATLRVSMPQGAYECGTATVSPLASGQSAYP